VPVLVVLAVTLEAVILEAVILEYVLECARVVISGTWP
jgi:hypothetical protein